LTEGLLGSNYISMTPGYANTNLKNGDKIHTTHSAIILENLIGQLMYKLDSGKSK
jgi:phospholipid/cholesterol/gamma-HCH transport system substrate-binding protein